MRSIIFAIALLGCEARPMNAGHLPDPLEVILQSVVVCAEGETLPGIDVSYYQDRIDWDAVAGDGIRFAIVRVSDGVGFEDPEFDRNWAEARRVGIVRGVYQFFRPNQDPIDQADLLLRRMGPLQPGDLPPVIDVEATGDRSPAQVAAAIRIWIDHVEAELGMRPIIYSGLYFWRDNVQSDDFADYPFWIAQYGRECPDIPEPWVRWAFFQTSSTGRIAGIEGNVDTNLFNGGLAEFDGFVGREPVCGDGYCSGGEAYATCAEDCPICEPVPAAGRVVEEDELCFALHGPAGGWRRVAGGSGGSMIWTHAVDGETANWAAWNFDLAEAGRYRLSVFTPGPHNESQQALYTVAHAGVVDEVRLDQSADTGWQVLGEYAFEAGADQSLRLEDGTGEPLAGMVQIVFDAVKLERLDLAPDAGPGPDAAAPRIDAAQPPPEDSGAMSQDVSTSEGADLSGGEADGSGPQADAAGPGFDVVDAGKDGASASPMSPNLGGRGTASFAGGCAMAPSPAPFAVCALLLYRRSRRRSLP